MTDTPNDSPDAAQPDLPPGDAESNATEKTVHVSAWQPPVQPAPQVAPTGDYYTPVPGQYTPVPGQQSGPAPYPGGVPQDPTGGYGTSAYPAHQGYPPPPPGYGQPGPYPTGAPTTGWQPTGQYQQSGPQQLPGAPANAQSGRRRLALIVGAVAAVAIAAVAITGFWLPGFLRTQQLDINAVQDGVKQVLTDTANGYGATNVSDVRCNDGANPTIKQGESFTCAVTVNGAQRQVKVTFGDNEGTYWVGGPS